MFKDVLSLDSILQQFETVLEIEYTDSKIHKVLDEAIKMLEASYKVTIDKDLYSLQAESQLVGDSISGLVVAIQESCKNLSLYIEVNIFNKSIGISLASVNYLGFAKSDLLHGLKYLQDKDLYTKRKSIIEPIESVLTNIEMCSIKRLCVIMLMLERLGISEGVAIIAQFLYLGGLVV